MAGLVPAIHVLCLLLTQSANIPHEAIGRANASPAKKMPWNAAMVCAERQAFTGVFWRKKSSSDPDFLSLFLTASSPHDT
jgi:hypothetical protein